MEVGVAVGVPGPGVGEGVGVLVGVLVGVGVAVGVPGPGVGEGVGVGVGVAVGVPGPGVGEGVGVLVGVGVGVAVGSGVGSDPGGLKTRNSLITRKLLANSSLPEIALHVMRMLDTYMGTVMKWMTLSVELAWAASLGVYIVVHDTLSKVRPRTLHDTGAARGSEVLIRMACTYVTAGMSSWIQAPGTLATPSTLLVTPDKPRSMMPDTNSLPDVQAESTSPSNAKYA